MRFLLLATASLSLAACSSEPDPVETADEFAERVQGAGETATVPGSSLNTVPPAPLPALGAPQPIPAKFIGVWDFVDGTCARDSDLRLDISQSRVQFYESVGTINGFEQVDADTVILNLAMSGEGEVWEERLRMELSKDGRTLEAIDVSAYGSGQAMPRKRCAG